MLSEQASRRALVSTLIVLFAVCTAATIAWSTSMTVMSDMPMAGGRSLSMPWAVMQDQTWVGALVSFLGMWIVMMVAMMLPSISPQLWRYRVAVRADRPNLRTTAFALGYSSSWTMLGIALFSAITISAEIAPIQLALARAAPFAAGAVVLMAGMFQFSAWKARHLEYCRAGPPLGRIPSGHPAAELADGMRLGAHCCCSCAGPMAILLMIGVMDLGAMAMVTAAVTIERLAPAGRRAAQAIGAVTTLSGILLIVRTSWPG